MAQPSPSVARLATVAGLIHFAFDQAGRAFEATTAPYLLLPYMSEVFREMLGMLGVTPVSAVTSAVNGFVSAIFAVAFAETAARRPQKLFAALFVIWVVTGGLTFALYLSAPAWIAAASLAAGLPRAAVLAFVLDRLTPRPEPEPAAAPGAASQQPR
ncbi:MAG TPA: hypothetical protein VFP50_03305 [Anaeromyxobacteraceae bacterium]|nr:hypothetical protein [Anaeromyxobacteraceae bacterium]